MPQIEILFFWVSVFTLVLVFCLYLLGFISQKRRAVDIALWVLRAGLVFLTGLVIIRWLAGGHPPVTDIYELNLTGAWFAILLFLIFERWGKLEVSIGLIVVPIVFLVLGYGFMWRTEASPMGPSYQSPWLVVHVIFAWLAFGSYTIATGASALFLLREKKPPRKSALKIPDAETLDLTSYRFITLGFINHAIMLASGAIWAKQLWGQYWSWDALETWSLLAFLYYAFCLHVRSFLGWKLRRAAWLTIIGLLVLAISFWGIEWISPSVHPAV